MTTNNLTNPEKAAVKRRQRARIKRGEETAIEKQRRTDLLQSMIDMKGQDPKVKAVARRAQKGVGAPLKLTPIVASRIIKYLMEGNYLSTSCQAAGVRQHTFLKWMRMAEEELENATVLMHEAAEASLAKVESAEAALESAEAERGIDPEFLEAAIEAVKTQRQAFSKLSLFQFVPEDRLIHVHLNRAISIAEAEAERSLLKKAGAGKRGWQASMTIMERRFRSGWGKKSEVDHRITGDEDRPVVIKYESDDSERAKRVAAILQTSNAIEGHATEVTDELEEQFEKESEGVEAID